MFSPSSLTPIYTRAIIDAAQLPGNAVYTLFMLGDAGAPIELLRKRPLTERAAGSLAVRYVGTARRRPR